MRFFDRKNNLPFRENIVDGLHVDDWEELAQAKRIYPLAQERSLADMVTRNSVEDYTKFVPSPITLLFGSEARVGVSIIEDAYLLKGFAHPVIRVTDPSIGQQSDFSELSVLRGRFGL